MPVGSKRTVEARTDSCLVANAILDKQAEKTRVSKALGYLNTGANGCPEQPCAIGQLARSDLDSDLRDTRASIVRQFFFFSSPKNAESRVPSLLISKVMSCPPLRTSPTRRRIIWLPFVQHSLCS